jgi:hypothetical protein
MLTKAFILDKIINIVESVIKLSRRRKRVKPFVYSAKNMGVFFHSMILK